MLAQFCPKFPRGSLLNARTCVGQPAAPSKRVIAGLGYASTRINAHVGKDSSERRRKSLKGRKLSERIRAAAASTYHAVVASAERRAGTLTVQIHERPRSEWIAVPVPAVVSEGTLALAQEQLERNKHHAQRRTIEPTLLQGMLVSQTSG